ncbi:phospholipase D-like domain-containing protein [Candidatus Dependentiae bacterium]
MKISKKRTFLLSIFVSLIFLTSFSNINLPESFGKKHFILGESSQEIISRAGGKNSIEDLFKPDAHGIRQVLFAPDDNVLQVLLFLIENEKTSIRMAAFLLTEYEVVKSILNARARGVQVEIVFDSKVVKSKSRKTVRLLVGRGIRVFVYRPRNKFRQKNISNIMHNKFIVFGENVFGRNLVWTGSFNFTYSAHKANQENVVIFDDSTLVKKFSDRFDYLKDKLCFVFKNRR